MPMVTRTHALGVSAKSLPLLWFGRGTQLFALQKAYGAPTRTRTADLLITNQLLYQLSYRGETWAIVAWFLGLITRKMPVVQCNFSVVLGMFYLATPTNRLTLCIFTKMECAKCTINQLFTICLRHLSMAFRLE